MTTSTIQPATMSKLRILNGTLRVKLTDDASEDLLVDREAVMAQCPTLVPPLRHPGESRYQPSWDKSLMVEVDGAEDQIRVSTLALNHVDGTYLLSGHVSLNSAVCHSKAVLTVVGNVVAAGGILLRTLRRL